MELELEAGRLHDLNRAATEAGHEAVSSRERWFAAVERESDGSAGRAGVEPERFAAESEWELAAWRRARAVRQRPAQQATMERARAEFLEGRRERMQIESLVEAARRAERRRDERGEQRRLDDWHQARSGQSGVAAEGDGSEGD